MRGVMWPVDDRVRAALFAAVPLCESGPPSNSEPLRTLPRPRRGRKNLGKTILIFANPETTQPALYKKFPTRLRTIKNTRNTRSGDLRTHGDREFSQPSREFNRRAASAAPIAISASGHLGDAATARQRL